MTGKKTNRTNKQPKLTKRAKAAGAFAKKWGADDMGKEKQNSHLFWIDLLQDVMEVPNATQYISFEDSVKYDDNTSTAFIDAYIPATKVLIEQKSSDRDLTAKIKQSDGTWLSPFEQAKRYALELGYSKRPRWIVTCNFRQFFIYDMERPQDGPVVVELKDLEKEVHQLAFLVDQTEQPVVRTEHDIDIKAGSVVNKLYELLKPGYSNPGSAQAMHDLNVLCVRLVFCLYAEDAGIFEKDQFFRYMNKFRENEFRHHLIRLFDMLDTPLNERDPHDEDTALLDFPYTNGGLYNRKEKIEMPGFSQEAIDYLLDKASLGLDWSGISPTVFGGIFESTLNPDTRREGGMHYTSVENIHKVIDPLMMDSLNEEFNKIAGSYGRSEKKKRNEALKDFQDKLARLTFLDPACGSGNFLSETYRSLRTLENKVIKLMNDGQSSFGSGDLQPIKVSIQQFHGIEINDFAVAVATTAIHICEYQMWAETQKLVNTEAEFLQLQSYANIREGNALLMDWDMIDCPEDHTPTIRARKAYITEEPPSLTVNEPQDEYRPMNRNVRIDQEYDTVNIVTRSIDLGMKPKERKKIHYDYIMGNPPFTGARLMTAAQKQDLVHVFGQDWKNIGNMDYVTGWYSMAADKKHHHTRGACLHQQHLPGRAGGSAVETADG